MIKPFMLAAIAAAAVVSMPVSAQPGIVMQDPSAALSGDTSGGNGCSMWRCGFNGTSNTGLTLGTGAGSGCSVWMCGFNGLTLTGFTLKLKETPATGIDTPAKGFAATVVTLPGGEVLAID
jgi:hypothetical protein